MISFEVTRNVSRGCGKRKKGGVYAEVDRSPFGRPLESFLFDPTLQVDFKRMALSNRKPVLRKLNPSDKHYAIIDVVGVDNYPNICDPLEEIRILGLSRRLELSQKEYELLVPGNPIILVIPQAFILPEALDYYHGLVLPMNPVGYKWNYCPKSQPMHKHESVNCAGLHWNRVDIGTKPLEDQGTLNERYIQRTIGSVTYKAARSPDNCLDLDPDLFTYGAVVMFYLSRLALVKAEDGSHEEKKETLKNINIPVKLTDE